MLLDEINLAPQDSTPRKTAVELAIHSTMTGSNLTTWSMQHGIYIIYIYSDPKADRLFFWRVRIYVGIMLDVGHLKK